MGTAGALGFHDDSGLLAVSLAAALPGLVGVAAGKRLGTWIPDRYRAAAVDALLSVVGTRLSWTGVTGP
ncbi:hypothetical protein BRD03_11005 [Halobacteriales archaeon QS_9_68_17]|nr:MAG: hypothetical protein BRD03_11005 [Halobacteriales archaeon QS_9_68_17]